MMKSSDETRLANLAIAAADLVEDGMVLGLGSGSTAEAWIHALGKRVRAGLSVSGVATSHRTEQAATRAGIPLTTLGQTRVLDLGIDGADEIDPLLSLTKGRGGALLHEKIVALACRRWVIVAASEKLVAHLGTRVQLPVEVIPFGWQLTCQRLEDIGLQSTLRLQGDGPFITDSGHYVLDCRMEGVESPESFADRIKELVGVVEHGFFLEMAEHALIGEQDGSVTTRWPVTEAAR